MFLDGVHCKIAPDGNIWVNLTEVEKWVEQGNQATQTAITDSSKQNGYKPSGNYADFEQNDTKTTRNKQA